jgi:hypothetical protein
LDAIVKIDELWAEASQDRFGFGAQARLWLEVGQDKSAFEIKVGWCPGPNKRQKDYERLTFDLDKAEVGHLPAFFKSWGGGGWSWTQYLLDRVAQSVDLVPLESERGVDYRKLRDLLKAGKWEEADRETQVVMEQATGGFGVDYLDLPWKDLRTIDQLWIQASNGLFGFSVQKKIWEECGRPLHCNWENFADLVGWRRQGEWKRKYSDLRKNLSTSPAGEFPFLNNINWVGLGWWALFSHKDL